MQQKIKSRIKYANAHSSIRKNKYVYKKLNVSCGNYFHCIRLMYSHFQWLYGMHIAAQKKLIKIVNLCFGIIFIKISKTKHRTK